jgi:hypothetical protein
VNKIIHHGITAMVLFVLAGIVGFGIFMATFDVFGAPDGQVIAQVCDQEGLRRVNVFKSTGNATTHPSLRIFINACADGPDQTDGSVIFTADKPSLADDDVAVEWLAPDTVVVKYSNALRIFRKETKVLYEDSAANIRIVYIVTQ